MVFGFIACKRGLTLVTACTPGTQIANRTFTVWGPREPKLAKYEAGEASASEVPEPIAPGTRRYERVPPQVLNALIGARGGRDALRSRVVDVPLYPRVDF